MALFPFILINEDLIGTTKEIIVRNHESIHYQQQKELLVLPFYVIYLYEFLVNINKGLNRRKAYRQISFEKEASANQNNLNYLKTRKKFTSFNL